MATLRITWTVSDEELALLQTLVAAGETVEAYVERVGLKGLRGRLAEIGEQRRAIAVRNLAKAFDAADAAVQDTVLAALGYTRETATDPEAPRP